MEFKDYYAALGVTRNATEKDIKQAFRRLARKYHPDVNPGDKAAESRFKEINEANEVLGNPDSRKKYDELGANWRQYDQARAAGQAPPPWGSAGHAGGRTVSQDEMADLFGDGTFSDFFSTFFGGAAGAPGQAGPRGARGAPGARTGRRPRRGRDIEHELELTLEEVFHGLTKRLALQSATGTRTVDVRIPAGVGDGSRVRVAGEGEQVAGAAGDLYLRVRIAPHTTFERRDRDLYVKLKLPVTTAVLGGEAAVPTLAGSTVRLKIPPLTQPGQLFRLKGYGMPPAGKTAEAGDAYARVEVQLPSALSPAAREHWEQLASLDR
jgi:DnaJ-class molecular chaperone